MDDQPLDRPSAQDVARRAFALAIYKFRADYESQWRSASGGTKKSFEEEVEDMASFLKETRLEESLSVNERTLFGRPMGHWHPQDLKDGSWSGENLIVLLWSLLRVNALPPVWELSAGVHRFADEEAENWNRFISEAKTRSVEEIEQMEGYVQAIRLRERTPDGFEGIPWLAQKALEFGGGAPIEGDLPIDGRPYCLATEEQKSSIRSVALERHKALCWLLGYEDDLDAPDPEV